MKEVRLLYITAANEEEALKIGRALVEERLCACANVYPTIRSVYWWEGRLTEDQEAVLIVKTRAELVPRVRERILALHSYTCPCILEIPVSGGHEDFIEWIFQETTSS